MLNALKSLFHIHKFKFSHKLGVNNYLECTCGSRQVKIDYSIGGYSPIDWDWVGGTTSDKRESGNTVFSNIRAA